MSYVICISSVVDSADSYDILFRAMEEIDNGLDCRPIMDGGSEMDIISGRESAVVPGKAWDEPSEKILLEQAEGRISGAFVYAYPPGIPVLAPGEIVDDRAMAGIRMMIKSGLNVSGVDDGSITVLCGDPEKSDRTLSV